MEQDVHAPAIDARGAAFPGVNLYVQLGRGRDYAWQRDLRRPGHHRHVRGRALRAGRRSADARLDALPLPRRVPGDRGARAHQPLAARRSPTRRRAGSADAARRAHEARARHARRGDDQGQAGASTPGCARPTCTRSTPRAASRTSTTPAKIARRRDFQRAACKIGYTFNWLYADDRDIAYFNSGDNPLRAQGRRRPAAGARASTSGGAGTRPQHRRLHVVRQAPADDQRQPYLTSWNNKQARGYAGADSNLFSSVFRSQMLDREIERADRRRAQDRRCRASSTRWTRRRRPTCAPSRCCRWRCEVIGRPDDRASPTPSPTLRAWVAAGSHRRDRRRRRRYEHADAIRIMDAWWPLWMRAQFEPSLGSDALRAARRRARRSTTTPTTTATTSARPTRRAGTATRPRTCAGCSGATVKAPYSKRYCGGGNLRALPHAAARRADRGARRAGVQALRRRRLREGRKPAATRPASTIVFRPLGGVTQPMIHWQNRPTYQQAVEVRATGRAERRG